MSPALPAVSVVETARADDVLYPCGRYEGSPVLLIRQEFFFKSHQELPLFVYFPVAVDCRSECGAGWSKGERTTASVADREKIEEDVEAQASRKQATMSHIFAAQLALLPTRPRSALTHKFLGESTRHQTHLLERLTPVR